VDVRLRRKHLRRLHLLTKCNVIAYYSGWLQKPVSEGTVELKLDRDNPHHQEAFRLAEDSHLSTFVLVKNRLFV
jgi:hypothetical protein